MGRAADDSDDRDSLLREQNKRRAPPCCRHRCCVPFIIACVIFGVAVVIALVVTGIVLLKSNNPKPAAPIFFCDTNVFYVSTDPTPFVCIQVQFPLNAWTNSSSGFTSVMTYYDTGSTIQIRCTDSSCFSSPYYEVSAWYLTNVSLPVSGCIQTLSSIIYNPQDPATYAEFLADHDASAF